MSQAIEVAARSELARRVVSFFVGSKDDQIDTANNRKNRFQAILDAAHSLGTVTELDIIGVQDEFVKEAKGSLKASTIKVTKSEIGRILSHLSDIPEDCTSWKSALKAIREVTTDGLTLAVDRAESLLASIAKAEERLSNLIYETAELEGWTVDFAASKIHQMIEARKNAAVMPANVAYMLKTGQAVSSDKADQTGGYTPAVGAPANLTVAA